MWNFVVGRAVRVNLGGTGAGAAVRFRGAETWHSTVHDAPASRARCLCGMGFYNKASIVGPLWYRLDTLMREVIVRARLGVDDLAAYGSNAYEFDRVEDRYLEALLALPMEPGTHPRDALARLDRGGAAPAGAGGAPERTRLRRRRGRRSTRYARVRLGWFDHLAQAPDQPLLSPCIAVQLALAYLKCTTCDPMMMISAKATGGPMTRSAVSSGRSSETSCGRSPVPS